MKFVHDTLEMVGIDERIGAIVPPRTSAARFGASPRAIRSWTSGSPTPSRPITATRDAAASPRPPCRSLSRKPTLEARPETGSSDPSGKYAAPASPAAARHTHAHAAHHSRSSPTQDAVSGRQLDLLLCNSDDFPDGRDAGADLLPAVLAQRPHAHLDARVPDDVGGRALEDQGANVVTHEQQLVDARASAVARVRALLAALPFPDLDRSAGVARDLAHRLEADLGRAAALAANFTHEALREHAEERRGEEVVLDAHLEETRDGARRVVRVQRREDEVAGERRLDRDLGRLGVADLADHDDVGVLADDRAQTAGEREADRRLHVDLVH